MPRGPPPHRVLTPKAAQAGSRFTKLKVMGAWFRWGFRRGFRRCKNFGHLTKPCTTARLVRPMGLLGTSIEPPLAKWTNTNSTSSSRLLVAPVCMVSTRGHFLVENLKGNSGTEQLHGFKGKLTGKGSQRAVSQRNKPCGFPLVSLDTPQTGTPKRTRPKSKTKRAIGLTQDPDVQCICLGFRPLASFPKPLVFPEQKRERQVTAQNTGALHG